MNNNRAVQRRAPAGARLGQPFRPHHSPHRAAQVPVSRHHSRLPIPLSFNLILNPATDEALWLQREAGQGQQKGLEAWMGRGRRGRSGFGAAGDPQKKCGPLPLRGGRAPRGAGRSRRRQRTRRQLPSPPPLSFPHASSQEKRGICGPKGMVGSLLLLLPRARQEVLSLRGTDVPHRDSRTP